MVCAPPNIEAEHSIQTDNWRTRQYRVVCVHVQKQSNIFPKITVQLQKNVITAFNLIRQTRISS